MNPRLIPTQTEDQAQRLVCLWLQAHQYAYCHVPNGGLRSKPEAARFKGLGVQPGVPDLLVFTPPPLWPEARGAAIELKRGDGKGRVSAEQEAWLERLRDIGWAVTVAHGSNEAIDWLEGLGYGRR